MMLSRGRADRRGSVAIMAAVSLTVLVGMAGIAIDVGSAYAQMARLQKTADSAAMAGAIAWVKTSSTAAVTATITDVVVANGWAASTIQAATGYMASSPKNAANPAVQVSLSASSSLTLAQAITSLVSVTTSAYSAAEITSASVACMLVLNQLQVNSSVSTAGCAVQDNGTASNAIAINGTATVTAAALETPGGVQNNGTINGNVVANGKVVNQGKISGSTTTGASTVTDPYSSLQSQASSGFTGCKNWSNQTTLTPGCWTNVNVNSGTVTLQSGGTYYFQNINVNSNGAITGSNVTMVTQSNFSPNGPVTLTAPTTGATAGVAIYAMGGMNFNSGVTYNITGAVYSPTGTINADGGTWNANACTYLVAQNLTFNSSSTFTLPQHNCSSYATSAPHIGTSSIMLVK